MAGVAGDPGSNPALGKQRSRDYPIDVPATPSSPMLTFATKKLPTGAGTKGGCSFFCYGSRSFDRAFMVANALPVAASPKA